MIKMNLFNGRNYVAAALRRIQLCKDIFMIHMNQGREIAIPNLLS